MSLSQKFSSVVEIKGELSQTFMKAMTGASRETNTFAARTKALSKSLAAVDRMAKGREGLKEQITRYAELRNQLAKVEAQMKATKTPSAALQGELNRLTSATSHARKGMLGEVESLKKLRNQLRDAKVDTTNLTAASVKLQAEVNKAKGNSEMMDKFKVATGKAGTAVQSLRSDVRHLVYAVTAISAASYGIYRLSKDSADFGVTAVNTGRAIGITGTQLQQTRYAMQKWGVETDQADASLKRLIRTTAAARDGLSVQGKLFQRLGIDPLVFSKLDMNSKLDFLAAGFSRIADANKRAEIGMEFFGKDKGAEIAEGLAQGPQKYSEALKEAIVNHAAFTDQENEEATRTAERMRNFEAQLTGLRHSLGIAVTPGVLKAIDGIGRFIRAHQAEILEFGKTLSTTIQRALPALGKLALLTMVIADCVLKLINIMPTWAMTWGVVSAAVTTLTFHLGVLAYSFVGLGRLLGMWNWKLPTLGRMLSATGAIIRTVVVAAWDALVIAVEGAAAVFGTTVGVVVGSAVAIGLAAYLVIKHWDPIRAWFIKTFESVAHAIDRVWTKMKAFFSWMVAPFKKLTQGIEGASIAERRGSITPGGGLPVVGRGALGVGRDALSGRSGSVSPTGSPLPGVSLPSGRSIPVLVSRGGSVTNHVHIYPHPKQSPHEIAAAVIKIITQKQKRDEALTMTGGSPYAAA